MQIGEYRAIPVLKHTCVASFELFIYRSKVDHILYSDGKLSTHVKQNKIGVMKIIYQ